MNRTPPKRDIEERAFQFACRILALSERLIRRGGVAALVGRQLAESGTSIGANLEEAVGAQTKPDFIAKNSVALKESRESRYWLRLTSACLQPVPAETEELTAEAGEFAAIITTIVRNARLTGSRG